MFELEAFTESCRSALREKPARRSPGYCGENSESTTAGFEITRRAQVVGYPIPLPLRKFDDSKRAVGPGYVPLSA
jgi:hypothetical protein